MGTCAGIIRGFIMMNSRWPVQFIVYIGIMVFGIGMAWAAYGVRISELEKSATTYSKDHDALISLNTKLDMLLGVTIEIQKDLKDHLKK